MPEQKPLVIIERKVDGSETKSTPSPTPKGKIENFQKYLDKVKELQEKK